MHEYAFEFAKTLKAQWYCSCKRRKFVSQDTVKICKLQSHNFKISGQTISCLTDLPLAVHIREKKRFVNISCFVFL